MKKHSDNRILGNKSNTTGVQHFVQTENYTENENYEQTHPECRVTVKKNFLFHEILRDQNFKY